MGRDKSETEWAQSLDKILAKQKGSNSKMPKKIFVINGTNPHSISLGARIILADTYLEAENILKSQVRKIDDFKLMMEISEDFSNYLQVEHLREDYNAVSIYSKYS